MSKDFRGALPSTVLTDRIDAVARKYKLYNNVFWYSLSSIFTLIKTPVDYRSLRTVKRMSATYQKMVKRNMTSV